MTSYSPADQTQNTYEEASRSRRVSAGQVTFRVREDSGDANILYVGEAAPGSAESAAVWRIVKIDLTTLADGYFADSNDSFDNVWADRESLTYG